MNCNTYIYIYIYNFNFLFLRLFPKVDANMADTNPYLVMAIVVIVSVFFVVLTLLIYIFRKYCRRIFNASDRESLELHQNIQIQISSLNDQPRRDRHRLPLPNRFLPPGNAAALEQRHFYLSQHSLTSSRSGSFGVLMSDIDSSTSSQRKMVRFGRQTSGDFGNQCSTAQNKKLAFDYKAYNDRHVHSKPLKPILKSPTIHRFNRAGGFAPVAPPGLRFCRIMTKESETIV